MPVNNSKDGLSNKEKAIVLSLALLTRTQGRVGGFFPSFPASTIADVFATDNSSQFRQCLKRLVEAGFIQRHGQRGNYTYSLEAVVLSKIHEMTYVVDVTWVRSINVETEHETTN